MKRHIIGPLAAAVALSWHTSLSFAESIDGGAQGRAWQVSDSIGMRYFGGCLPYQHDEIGYSPRGSYFWFITCQGDLASDTRRYELNIYDVSIVKAWIISKGSRAIEPTRRLQVSTTNGDDTADTTGIAFLQWDSSERAVFFLGQGDDGRQQVFEYELRTRRLRQRTNHVRDIHWFSAAGRTIVFGDYSVVPRDNYPVAALSLEVRTTLPAYAQYVQAPALVSGQYVQLGERSPRRLHVPLRRSFRILERTYEHSRQADFLWLSPDGETAIVFEKERLFELNLRTLRETALQGIAPNGSSTSLAHRIGVLWSANGRRVILVDVRVPPSSAFSGTTACESAAIEYDLATQEWDLVQCLPASPDSVSVAWLNSSEVEILFGGNRTVHRVRSEPPNTNVGMERGQGPTLLLEVQIRQSTDSPPQVFAKLGSRERAITSSDAALNGIWRAEQTPFSWSEPDGTLVTGGLYLPRDHERARPVPLVVQPYVHNSRDFLPDGDNSTIDATQLLVARGFAVLKYDIRNASELLPSIGVEGRRAVERLDAAVAALAASGIVDPSRVGLTGFSRSGYQTYYAITHPGRTRLAAAIAADAWTGSFGSYLTFSARGVTLSEFEWAQGGNYWQDRDQWHALENTFNVASVHTPFMYTYHADVRGYQAMPHIAEEVVGAFAITRRPLEYLHFPNAPHNLQRPRQRRAMLDAAVDWMAFWILNEEDSDPAKADQYRRWRVMRDQWRRQQAWEAAGNPIGSTPMPNFQPALSNSVPTTTRH